MNFFTRLVNYTDVQTKVLDPRIAAKPPRQLLTVLDRGCGIGKPQTNPVPRRGSVFHIEKVSAHE